jgi:hypothetical protein
MESISSSSITISQVPIKSRPVATLKRSFSNRQTILFHHDASDLLQLFRTVLGNSLLPLGDGRRTMAGGWRIIKNKHLLGLDHE